MEQQLQVQPQLEPVPEAERRQPESLLEPELAVQQAPPLAQVVPQASLLPVVLAQAEEAVEVQPEQFASAAAAELEPSDLLSDALPQVHGPTALLAPAWALRSLQNATPASGLAQERARQAEEPPTALAWPHQEQVRDRNTRGLLLSHRLPTNLSGSACLQRPTPRGSPVLPWT